MHTNILAVIKISLFYYCGKVFMLLNIQMMYHYLMYHFNDVSLPEKEDFYSHLRMENITDAAYGHAKSLQRI